MQLLTFSFSDSSTKHIGLVECPESGVSNEMWQEFAGFIAQDEHLISYPYPVFRERWQQGHAAVMVKDNHIISYTSLVPIFDSTTRRELALQLGVEPTILPEINLYEFATGWTHPDWRRRDVNLQLRIHLLDRFSAPNCLCVSVAIGIGASPLLSRLAWRLVGWHEIAYASSLIGLPITGFESHVGDGWQPPEDIPLYEGPHIEYTGNGAHNWKHFCHFWVSSTSLATELNNGLAEVVQGDLSRWRAAVVAVFTDKSKADWKLTFFKEQGNAQA